MLDRADLISIVEDRKKRVRIGIWYGRDEHGRRLAYDFLYSDGVEKAYRANIKMTLAKAITEGEVIGKRKFKRMSKNPEIWVVYHDPIGLFVWKHGKHCFLLHGYVGIFKVYKDNIEEAKKLQKQFETLLQHKSKSAE